MSRLFAVIVAMAVLVSGLSGCGDESTYDVPMAADDRAGGVEPRESPGAPEPTVGSEGVSVLYDDEWVVEEGQWWIGQFPEDEEAMATFQHILESVGETQAVITVPGLYGRYRVRVELHPNAPPVAGWCEDLAEASLLVDPASNPEPPVMGSFETFSDPLPLEAGWYRVRYCTEQQDVASRQEEFTGDEYTIYAGRHLLQLWRAPQAPDEIIRTTSAFARNPGQPASED